MIVFKIFGDANIFSSQNGQRFENDSDEWKKVISFFRSGKDPEMVEGPAQAQELKSLDYIFGPIADSKFRRHIPTPEPKAFKDMKYQLCLRTQTMAHVFYNYGKNVYKTIFFCDTTL